MKQQYDNTIVTLKVDKQGRLCAWAGNVQSELRYDKFGKLVAKNGALYRLEGHDKDVIMAKLPDYIALLVERGFSMVLSRKGIA